MQKYLSMVKAVNWLLAIALLSGCGSSPTSKPVKVLVLMDKTLSIQTDNDKYAKALINVLENNQYHFSDKWQFAIHFIHANTAACTPFFESNTMMFQCLEDNPDPNAISIPCKVQLNAAKLQLDSIIRLALAEPSDPATNRQTDLWYSIQLIDNHINSNQKLFVYYLSDMVEASFGPDRKNYQSIPIASATEAEAFAEQDADSIKKLYALHPDNWKNVAVKILLPVNPQGNSNKKYMFEYWRKLFELLGANSVS